MKRKPDYLLEILWKALVETIKVQIIKIETIKKTYANAEIAPWKGFNEQMFKLSIHPQRYWRQKYQITIKSLRKMLVYGFKQEETLSLKI